MLNKFFAILVILALGAIALVYLRVPSAAQEKGGDLMEKQPEGYPTAILAGGCFWCVESEYRRLDGVLHTRVGYIGGHIDNPKYEDTHDSKSGHAEAVEITYDPDQISFRELLNFFFTQVHDPTQLNRQGPDVGTQYRSAVFYQDEEQKEITKEVIQELAEAERFDDPIVTTLEPATKFWEAEDYHQQYYEKYEEKNGKPHINDWLKRQERASSQ